MGCTKCDGTRADSGWLCPRYSKTIARQYWHACLHRNFRNPVDGCTYYQTRHDDVPLKSNEKLGWVHNVKEYHSPNDGHFRSNDPFYFDRRRLATSGNSALVNSGEQKMH